jgi:hypothetical protein
MCYLCPDTSVTYVCRLYTGAKKVTKENTLFLPEDVVREWTSLIHARTARFLRAITLDLRLRVTGIKSLETLHCTKPGSVALQEQKERKNERTKERERS